VRPAAETPNFALDYAALTAAYGALLATVGVAAHHRAGETEPIGRGELIPLGFATFALARTMVHEKIVAWLREPFVEDEGTPRRRPRGRGLRYTLGELMTCTRCVGTWSALALTGLRVTHPATGRTVIAVLAATGVNDFLQAGFARATR
jgi:Protein of unknown function (DUF1360)